MNKQQNLPEGQDGKSDFQRCRAPASAPFQGPKGEIAKKILFVCIHNSARSQMAEAFVNHLCRDICEAHSAGLEPGKLNPLVVEAMGELGIDISKNQTKSVQDMLKSGVVFTHVITVCDEFSAERCPMFAGGGERLHWGFPDPSDFAGSREEKLARTREVRDAIKAKVQSWCVAA